MSKKILKYIKKQLKNTKIWTNYKKCFRNKKQRFPFVFLDELFDLELSEEEILLFESNLVLVKSEESFKKQIFDFFKQTLYKIYHKLLLSNLATFIYYSTKHNKKNNFENEAKRRNSFNNFSLLMVHVSSDFNSYVISLLKKFK